MRSVLLDPAKSTTLVAITLGCTGAPWCWQRGVVDCDSHLAMCSVANDLGWVDDPIAVEVVTW